MPPADLAQRLVAASEEILRPDRDLRLEEVAALVGSKRATLYYYFSGREDLIAFLLEEHLDAAAAALTGAEPDGRPAVRLRAGVAALIEFLGGRPGLCAGLLSFAGATGRVKEVMAAKDAKLVEPIRTLLDADAFVVGDAHDAANAILGAIMIATLGRWQRGADLDTEFRTALADQVTRGVAARP